MRRVPPVHLGPGRRAGRGGGVRGSSGRRGMVLGPEALGPRRLQNGKAPGSCRNHRRVTSSLGLCHPEDSPLVSTCPVPGVCTVPAEQGAGSPCLPASWLPAHTVPRDVPGDADGALRASPARSRMPRAASFQEWGSRTSYPSHPPVTSGVSGAAEQPCRPGEEWKQLRSSCSSFEPQKPPSAPCQGLCLVPDFLPGAIWGGQSLSVCGGLASSAGPSATDKDETQSQVWGLSASSLFELSPPLG